MTMANSIELRVPYLDREVLRKSCEFSDRAIIGEGTTKGAFRRTAVKKIDERTAFRVKKGFPVPFRNWIKDDKYSAILVREFKSPSCMKFFDTDKLIAMLSDHICGKHNYARILYTVYAFSVWYGQYFPENEIHVGKE